MRRPLPDTCSRASVRGRGCRRWRDHPGRDSRATRYSATAGSHMFEQAVRPGAIEAIAPAFAIDLDRGIEVRQGVLGAPHPDQNLPEVVLRLAIVRRLGHRPPRIARGRWAVAGRVRARARTLRIDRGVGAGRPSIRCGPQARTTVDWGRVDRRFGWPQRVRVDVNAPLPADSEPRRPRQSPGATSSCQTSLRPAPVQPPPWAAAESPSATRTVMPPSAQLLLALRTLGKHQLTPARLLSGPTATTGCARRPGPRRC